MIKTKPELFEFQREDVDKIKSILASNKAMLLASEMGAGKTAVAIATAVEMGCECILVLCPASVRSVWAKELATWAPEMDVSLPDTKDPGRRKPGWNIVATSVAFNDKHVHLREIHWDMVIVDEAHQGGFKGYTGMQWNSSKMGWAFFGKGGIVGWAKNIMFLTGTPVPNFPIELWPMASVILPRDQTLARRDLFVARYCGGSVDGRFGPDERGSSHLDELRRKLKPFIVRRMKKDVLAELPDKSLKMVELPPTEEIKRVLDFETGDIITSKQTIDSIRERMAAAKDCNSMKAFEAAKNALAKAGDIAREQLVVLRKKLSIPKVTLIAGYVELLLETKKKVIVFYHHTDHGKGLEVALAKYGALRIGGDTPSVKRGEIIRRFQEGSERVMIGQLRAAGAGITLTAASDVVLGELDWTPGVIAQAAARSHRPGQEEDVTIHIICIEGSPDVLVANALIKKLKHIHEVVDGKGGGKKRAAANWIGKGLYPRDVGEKLTLEDRKLVHAEVFRIVTASREGTVGDGVGFSRVFEGRAEKLALTRLPTAEAYGEMALLLVRHPHQHKLPEELVKRVVG